MSNFRMFCCVFAITMAFFGILDLWGVKPMYPGEAHMLAKLVGAVSMACCWVAMRGDREKR